MIPEISGWTINENNVFDFPQNVHSGFFIVALTILDAISISNIGDEDNPLDVYVDITKSLHSKKDVSIKKIFLDHWKYDYSNGSSNVYHRMSVELIYEMLFDFLSQLCEKENHPEFYSFSKYKSSYNEKLNSYLNSNSSLDYDESDFILDEIERCDLMMEELKKPIYSIIINDSNFSSILKSRLRKRVLFLNEKQNIASSQFLDVTTVPDLTIDQSIYRENPSKTEIIIIEEFETMDKAGWQYAFKEEKDFVCFISLLTDFFEFNNYKIPNKVISLKKLTKTKVAKVLSEIHKQLSEKPISSDSEFYKIVRILNHFEGLSDNDLYRTFTK